MTDSVAVDAKRILLRYGAPIAILDKVSESHRIDFAREIAKTVLPEREPRLRQLLAEHGYTEFDPTAKNAKGKSRKGTTKAASTGSPKPASGKAEPPKSANSRPAKAANATSKAKASRPKAAKSTRRAKPGAKKKRK